MKIAEFQDRKLHTHRKKGAGQGRQAPNNLREGPTYPLPPPPPPPPPPNYPPTFSFNFYVKQEKSQMYQVEG